jgi:acetoacetyl-CoA synthetase
MESLAEGTLLWQPPRALLDACALRRYMDWLTATRGLQFAGYAELWRWSVDEPNEFWRSIWEFFELGQPAPPVALANDAMPGATWFPGAALNYAVLALRQRSSERPAIIFQSETHPLQELGWDALAEQVAAVADGLRALGVQRGDRVAAYLPNCPQAVVAFLASASIGAIWSSCSPDMGAASVLDRFRQIEPAVLLAIDGYQYGGKRHDRLATVDELRRALPSLRASVLVPYLDTQVAAPEGMQRWEELASRPAQLACEALPFDHPLWILYSSGTTGLPKPIVQGHGGIVLEHLKSLALHMDLGPGDRFFWFTTTGWMMWNFLVGGLLVGCTIVLYDGSPAWPDMGALWALAERAGLTCFGASAAYIGACMKARVEPRQRYDLSRLRSVGSTGSPLSVEGFAWVYQHVGAQVWLASISGGTDLCTAFVGGCPLLPVRAGEIQCRCLGARVEARDERGQPVIGEVGELVISAPMPSMPLFFWNDPGGQRYLDSYFGMYPGIWRHGDWVKLTEHGGVVIYGRSDATINRMGVRTGTAEYYRVIEELAGIDDSLVVDLEGLRGASYMVLFVVPAEGVALDDALEQRIRQRIRQALSPRHVPDEIAPLSAIPRTLNGKKMETPVKRLLLGAPPEQVLNRDTMSNPAVVDEIEEFARMLRARLKL